jgi:hypothetical protein
MRTLILSAAVLLATPSLPAAAQPQPTQEIPKPANGPAVSVQVKVDAQLKEDAIKQGIQVLLKLEQRKDHAEWPYEGVYRVAGQIPWGYRVGGTAICVSALTEAPATRTTSPARKPSSSSAKLPQDCGALLSTSLIVEAATRTF